MTHIEVRVGPHGRVVIPAEIRRAVGVNEGSRLVVSVDVDGRIVLEDRRALARRGRGSWRELAEGSDLLDDLLAARRAEAALEDAEASGDPGAEASARTGLAELRAPKADAG